MIMVVPGLRQSWVEKEKEKHAVQSALEGRLGLSPSFPGGIQWLRGSQFASSRRSVGLHRSLGYVVEVHGRECA